MHRLSPSGPRIHPIVLWLVVLGLIFATEYAVMVILPWLLPQSPMRLLDATIDSVLLTIVIAPALWWMVVRPLQQAMSLRTRFLTQSLANIEAERRHIAHELHDGVGQSLTLLVSGLRSLPEGLDRTDLCRRSQDLQQLAQTALKDIKKLSLGLRPSLLDDLGLAPAVERIVADVRENHPLDVTADVAAVAGQRLPESVETAVFRILQESISNIVKHSGARKASVKIRLDRETVVLEVTDDGVGIDPAILNAPHQAAGCLGLLGMRERAAVLGGQLEIESEPGRGTRLLAILPTGRLNRG